MNKISVFHKICKHVVQRSASLEVILKPRHLCTGGRKYQVASFHGKRQDEKAMPWEQEKDYVVATDKREIPEISWDTSIRYMESESYKGVYGNDVVWKNYRRNYKGYMMPDTREKCIRQGKIATGSPCPLCRDEYLVVDYRNIKLISQFVNPFTGELYPTMKTGVCQRRFTELQFHLAKAVDYGFMRENFEIRKYDVQEYTQIIKQLLEEDEASSHYFTGNDTAFLTDYLENKESDVKSIDSENVMMSEKQNLESVSTSESSSDSSSDSSDSDSSSDSDNETSSTKNPQKTEIDEIKLSNTSEQTENK